MPSNRDGKPKKPKPSAPQLGYEEAQSRPRPSYILSIDPGPESSAFLLSEAVEPLVFLLHGIAPNQEVLHLVRNLPHRAETHLVVEMVSNYSKAVGWTTFETVYWIGRFCQGWDEDPTLARIHRAKVRSHICASFRAGDAEIWQALVDRFGPGKDRAVGTKKAPGPLYGINSHVRSALAVGVAYWDMLRGVHYQVIAPSPSSTTIK